MNTRVYLVSPLNSVAVDLRNAVLTARGSIMPLYKRTVSPINVGRSPFAVGAQHNTVGAIVANGGDDVEAAQAAARAAQAAQAATLVGSQEEAANRTLANIIRQLASLGKHANDIFGI